MNDHEATRLVEKKAAKLYKPWVGLIVGFLVSGAAHFFAGQRKAGVVWLVAFIILPFVWAFLIATRLIPSIIPGLVVAVGTLVAWFVMLMRSRRPMPQLGAGRWILLVILFIAIPLLRQSLIRSLVQPFYVPTGGMEPTIRGASQRGANAPKDGDHLFVEKYAYWSAKPKSGDVIVFATDGLGELPPGEVYVKRVVGLPGDRVAIRNNRLVVNGVAAESPEFFATHQYFNMSIGTFLRTETDEYVVPNSGYFVIGDNSKNSLDSRFWGVVPPGNILGRCSKIYWPFARAGVVR